EPGPALGGRAAARRRHAGGRREGRRRGARRRTHPHHAGGAHAERAWWGGLHGRRRDGPDGRCSPTAAPVTERSARDEQTGSGGPVPASHALLVGRTA